MKTQLGLAAWLLTCCALPALAAPPVQAVESVRQALIQADRAAISASLDAMQSSIRLGPDPISFTGHGGLFDSKGELVANVTPDFIASALGYYTARALLAASPSQRAEHRQKYNFIEALTAKDRPGQLMAEALLLDWLIAQAQPADADALRVRNATLKTYLQPRSAGPVEDFQRAMLAQAGLAAAAAATGGLPAPPFAVAQKREAYMKRCVEAGVPKPPDWDPSGGTGWVSKTELPRVFISTDKTAELFAYESTTPAGICLALPRYVAGAATDIDLLGIICMGKSKAGTATRPTACFWDNQVSKFSTPVGRTVKIPIANFAAGEELKDGQGEVCTMCHAGENSFIVHPDQAPFRGLKNLIPDDTYAPIVDASWPQNDAFTTSLKAVAAPGKACTDCHFKGDAGLLPKIEKKIKGYCGAVLLPSIRFTMPRGGGPRPNDKYKEHIKVLTDECTAANAAP